MKKQNYYSYDLKEKILNLYFDNQYTVLELPTLFNISKSSIYNWIKLFNSNLLEKNKKEYIRENSFFRNPLIRINIKFYINKYPNFMYLNLISYIYKKVKITISKSTPYNIINDLNFSKKIVSFKKIYGSADKLKQKTIILKNKIKPLNKNNIISIDEVSFDTNIINNRAWSQKGKTIIKTIGATYKRFTVVCAISNEKILHYEIIKNSSKSNDFLNFLSILKNKFNLNNKFLFLDNAKIHHSKLINEYITKNNINFIFNVPYSPEYNPIELMFSKLKEIVKEYKNNNILLNLKKNIIKSFKKIKNIDLSNFFKHAFNKLLI